MSEWFEACPAKPNPLRGGGRREVRRRRPCATRVREPQVKFCGFSKSANVTACIVLYWQCRGCGFRASGRHVGEVLLISVADPSPAGRPTGACRSRPKHPRRDMKATAIQQPRIPVRLDRRSSAPLRQAGRSASRLGRNSATDETVLHVDGEPDGLVRGPRERNHGGAGRVPVPSAGRSREEGGS